MKTVRIISVLFVLLLVGTGTTIATAEPAVDHTAESLAGDSSIYSFDVTGTDTHGTGKLMINVKQHKFIFNGQGFDQNKSHFLHYSAEGPTGIHVLASEHATSSGNLHIEGEWTTDSLELPAGGSFGVSVGLGANYIVNFLYIDHLIENKNLLIETGKDIEAGKMTTGGNSGAGMVFGLINMAVSKYRYNNIMDELNTMDAKVDELLTDMGAIQHQASALLRRSPGVLWILLVHLRAVPHRRQSLHMGGVQSDDHADQVNHAPRVGRSRRPTREPFGESNWSDKT